MGLLMATGKLYEVNNMSAEMSFKQYYIWWVASYVLTTAIAFGFAILFMYLMR